MHGAVSGTCHNACSVSECLYGAHGTRLAGTKWNFKNKLPPCLKSVTSTAVRPFLRMPVLRLLLCYRSWNKLPALHFKCLMYLGHSQFNPVCGCDILTCNWKRTAIRWLLVSCRNLLFSTASPSRQTHSSGGEIKERQTDRSCRCDARASRDHITSTTRTAQKSHFTCLTHINRGIAISTAMNFQQLYAVQQFLYECHILQFGARVAWGKITTFLWCFAAWGKVMTVMTKHSVLSFTSNHCRGQKWIQLHPPSPNVHGHLCSACGERRIAVPPYSSPCHVGLLHHSQNMSTFIILWRHITIMFWNAPAHRLRKGQFVSRN
jgi:hypothetical protein